jgi:mannose-6-phosphate isomerase-like protein (cupin superfamily)
MRPEKIQTVALSRGFDSRHLHEFERRPFRGPSFVRLEDSRSEESALIGWVGDIEHLTLENETFRTVLFTGEHAQLTVMRLASGEDIGKEVHPDRDQFIRVEEGQARVEFGRSEDEVDEAYDLSDDWAVVVPAGIWHNVINTGSGELKLYSLYAPPEHPDGTVHRTKADAEAAEHAG